MHRYFAESSAADQSSEQKATAVAAECDEVSRRYAYERKKCQQLEEEYENAKFSQSLLYEELSQAWEEQAETPAVQAADIDGPSSVERQMAELREMMAAMSASTAISPGWLAPISITAA